VHFVKWQEWLGAGVVATVSHVPGKQFIHNGTNKGIVDPLRLSHVFILRISLYYQKRHNHFPCLFLIALLNYHPQSCSFSYTTL